MNANLCQLVLNDERPSFTKLFQYLSKHLTLLNEMESTPQEFEWHGEGNVLIHTEMVLNQCYKLLEKLEGSLSEEEQFVLIMGAMLHDIAKPFTTIKKGFDDKIRIISPRHAEKGRSYLALRLGTLGIDFQLQAKILNLVGYHHHPLRFIRKEKSIGSYRALANQVDPKLLYLFELCDLKGRICNDLDEQIEQIEMFKLYCQEYGVWDFKPQRIKWINSIREELKEHPIQFQEAVISQGLRDWESEKIFSPQEAIARTYSMREGYPEFTLLCGASGSGKSTWVEKNASSETQIISMDKLRKKLTKSRAKQSSNQKVFYQAKEELRDGLRNKRKIIWDATNTRKDTRRALFRLAMDYSAHTTLIGFQASPQQLSERNRSRKHSIPQGALNRQLKQLEWPEMNEAHRSVIIDNLGNVLYDSRKDIFSS